MEPRLAILAEWSEPFARIAEIGAGPGHLTGALIDRGHQVIVTDASPAAVQGLTLRFGRAADIRRGDGLTPIQSTEADLAILAGFGGRTIRTILDQHPERFRSWALMVQPMQDFEAVVGALRRHRRGVSQAMLVLSGHRLYPTLLALPEEPWNAPDCPEWDKLGWWLRRDALWPTWIAYHLEKAARRQRRIAEQPGSVARNHRLVTVQQEISWLEERLDVQT